jgi:hypothetical protein
MDTNQLPVPCGFGVEFVVGITTGRSKEGELHGSLKAALSAICRLAERLGARC